MEFTDKEWEFWSREPYPPSCPTYACDPRFGTPAEPASARWCASIVSPLKALLEKPFTILDFGCGDGRLFNFLSRRFQDFKYYGLERPGAHGSTCLTNARSFFGHDPRASFDFLGSPLETEAMGRSRIAIMGSIATHIPFPQFEEIAEKMMPLLKSGGILVASFFIEDKYELRYGQLYGHPDCYGFVSYTQEQLDGLCGRLGLKAEQKETCFTEQCLHRLLHFVAT